MYLHSKLQNRSKPIKIGFIGCGKFVSMFLAQYNQLEKIQIDSIVDVNIEKAKKNCLKSGLNEKTVSSINFTNSLDNTLERDIEIYIEATGNPIIGTVHATKIINNKKHIILVNVEADVTCGKFLSDLANKNNVVCSMAYGDQPSLIMEQIEWARLNGFQVICAGKGTKYHPTFEYSTPETVWDHYGLTKERAEKESGMNPKMFNSFLCGDKSAIEMCAVSNAADLKCPKDGLTFPPVGVYDIAKKLIPKDEGGLIDHSGQVEVISSIDLDKNEIENDLRWGVYIVIKAQNEYVKNCFKKILSLNANFYSLQNEIWDRDLNYFKSSNLIDCGDYKLDELSSLISKLNLVISCDTSILHLASSLNIETWGILCMYPDWRWGEFNKFNPYNKLKLFNQKKFCNWDFINDEIYELLEKKLN